MKTKAFILGLASFLTITFISCDSDGNTGNGANDPTSQFESDKTIKAGDTYSSPGDTSANETSMPNTVDTTMVEGRHK